jgi:hypothetical protein
MKINKFDKIKDLDKYLEDDVKNISNSFKDDIVIMVNFPLGKNFKEIIEPEEKDSFGYFCKYTIRKGLEMVSRLKKKGKNVKIAFAIDDHALMEINDWYLSYYNGFEVTDNIRKNIEEYFKDFKLPKYVQKIMSELNLTEKDILHSHTFKTPYFQESAYRSLYERKNPNKKIGCADEVVLIYEDLEKQGIKDIFFFIPHRCKAVTCYAVIKYNKIRKEKKLNRIRKKHIYLSSNRTNKEGEIIDSLEKLEKDTREILGGLILMKFS